MCGGVCFTSLRGDSKDSGRARAGIYAEPAAAESSSLLFKDISAARALRL
jgi:hypothetical protein